ncbi:putative E3 ubiquitin-protein ligase ARI2 (mitochondrion) [Artemisia annua]|uniref:Putative E3 ubiquitin-protein ligase ARI2 n=1 Tax=Artemisia annua TaxID=35608 RepID=A0A2U1QA04_ARTAN|nr:putative E3 ubiquitin-protein ligase ARI2 [Artemisia annua]
MSNEERGLISIKVDVIEPCKLCLRWVHLPTVHNYTWIFYNSHNEIVSRRSGYLLYMWMSLNGQFISYSSIRLNHEPCWASVLSFYHAKYIWRWSSFIVVIMLIPPDMVEFLRKIVSAYQRLCLAMMDQPPHTNRSHFHPTPLSSAIILPPNASSTPVSYGKCLILWYTHVSVEEQGNAVSNCRKYLDHYRFAFCSVQGLPRCLSSWIFDGSMTMIVIPSIVMMWLPSRCLSEVDMMLLIFVAITKESLLVAERKVLCRVMESQSLREHHSWTLLTHYHWDIEMLFAVLEYKDKALLLEEADWFHLTLFSGTLIAVNICASTQVCCEPTLRKELEDVSV